MTHPRHPRRSNGFRGFGAGLWSAVLILAAVSLNACDTRQPESGIELEQLATPAPPGSFAPRLVSLEDGRVLLSWLEETGDGHALRFALHDGGEWEAPRTVAEGGDWFANWADTPGVIPVGEKLFAHWLVSSGGGTFEYEIHAAWSDDEGRSWNEPFLVHRDGKPAEYGFLTGVVLPDGDLGLGWLDGRAMADDPPGAMSLRWARFAPGSSEPRDRRELDGRVCECCMTATVERDGRPMVFYRDRSEDEIRDIGRVSRHEDGWSEPEVVAADGWEISGCPVNGPAADAVGSRAAVAWYTNADGDARVQLADIDEQGGIGAVRRVDAGEPLGRAATLLDPEDGAWVVWLESETDGAALMARRVPGEGEPLAPSRLTAMAPGRTSGFPVLTRAGERRMLAWTDVADEQRRVRVGELRLVTD